MRKTKILATLGPASRATDRLTALANAGVDAVRLNFSHGSHEEHRAMVERVRHVSDAIARPIGVLQDLQGPKIRLGKFEGGSSELREGDSFAVTTVPREGDSRGASTTYAALARDVKPGDRILLADGALALRVETCDGITARCRVETGGIVRDHQGLNLPGVAISAPALSVKDLADLDLGLDIGVDFVAISFVRRANDIALARERVLARGRRVPIIAKIERPEAVDALDEILDAADGVMVARGDLAVELSPERVPVIQKRIIRAANARGKLVVTATQMLESMTRAPRPTRAEASDVANAVLDGTDAVMLSGETAVGDYPVETVRMMSAICEEVEASDLYRALPAPDLALSPHSVAHACALSTVAAARDLKLPVIACFTHSGATAAALSDLRPAARILALTPSEETRRKLTLCWGVYPVLVEVAADTDTMVALVERTVLDNGLANSGDAVAITMGVPVAAREETNLLKLHRLRGRT